MRATTHTQAEQSYLQIERGLQRMLLLLKKKMMKNARLSLPLPTNTFILHYSSGAPKCLRGCVTRRKYSGAQNHRNNLIIPLRPDTHHSTSAPTNPVAPNEVSPLHTPPHTLYSVLVVASCFRYGRYPCQKCQGWHRVTQQVA